MDDDKNLLDAARFSEYFLDSGLESPPHHASEYPTRTNAALLPNQPARAEKSRPFPEAQLGTQSLEASTKRKTGEFTNPTYSPYPISLHGICGCPLESPCAATEEWDEFVDNYGHLERTLHEAQTARWYVAPPHYHHAESPDETWEMIQMLLGMVVINWQRYVEYLRPVNGLALPGEGCQVSMKEWQLVVYNDLRNMSGVAAGKIAPEEMACSQDVKILAAELLRFQARLKIRSEETPGSKALSLNG